MVAYNTAKTTATFDLLQLKERLTENLSSAHIADTLDALIFKAIRPLMFATNHVEQTLVELLPFIASNTRRKFSNINQAELVDLIFTTVVASDKKVRLRALRKARLERTVYFCCLDTFQRTTETCCELTKLYCTSKSTKERAYVAGQLQAMAEHLQVKPGQPLYPLMQKVIYWANNAYTFKGMIIEKFIRLAYIESMEAKSHTQLDIDSDDLFKDLILAIAKAIDKYDSEKGPLTSYIKWWFLDARTPFHNAHEYSVTYHMPTEQRKKILAGSSSSYTQENLSSILDTDVEMVENHGLVEKLIQNQENDISRNLMINSDKDGFACLIHNIEYVPTDEDIQKMRNTYPK